MLLCCILYSLGSCSDILPQGDVLSDIKTRALSRNSDSLYYYYKGKKVALRANFSYRGYPVNLATEFIFNRDPIIYGIEQLHVYTSDNRLDFKIDCADPEAAITCQGDNVIEFPYAGDADYMFEQSLYFSIVPYSGFRFYPNETYTVND